MGHTAMPSTTTTPVPKFPAHGDAAVDGWHTNGPNP